MRSLSLSCGVFLAFVLSPGVSQSADWPRFRGPNGAAVSDDRETPVDWSASKNIVWRTQLPGPGTSSPITTGGKIFLTSYTGFGVDSDNPGDPSQLERVLVCLDEMTGKLLWQKEVKSVLHWCEWEVGWAASRRPEKHSSWIRQFAI